MTLHHLPDHAALLRELNGSMVLLELRIDAAEEPEEAAQRREDFRLGLPLDRFARHPPLPLYQRARSSIVWHWRRECPGHPGGYCITLQGEPVLGWKCRRCAELGVPWQR